MILGIINHFISRVIMRVLLVVFSLLLSSISFAATNDGIYAHLQTNKGKIVVELAFKKAPLTVINFIALSEGTKKSNKDIGVPFYDGISFHRVIDDFMIQGGDPLGTGTGGPGYRFEDEAHPELTFDKPYMLAMANAGPGTNGSQFFVTVAATTWLNFKHTIFGEVADQAGRDVVDAIAAVETGSQDRPKVDVVMQSIEIVRS